MTQLPRRSAGALGARLSREVPGSSERWPLSQRLCDTRRLVVSPCLRLIGGEGMELKVGNRVKVESESTERSPRTGVIEEVIRDAGSPRYRIRWDDGHESIYTPAAGAVSRAQPIETA